MDTNVLIPGIEHESEIEKRIIKMAKRKRKLILLPQNYKELRAEKAKTTEGKKRITEFKRKNRSKVVKVPVPNEEELSKMPGNGNDRIISFEAKHAGAKEIVSFDKRYKNSINKSNLFKAFLPEEYLNSFKKRKKRNKKRINNR